MTPISCNKASGRASVYSMKPRLPGKPVQVEVDNVHYLTRVFYYIKMCYGL